MPHYRKKMLITKINDINIMMAELSQIAIGVDVEENIIDYARAKQIIDKVEHTVSRLLAEARKKVSHGQ